MATITKHETPTELRVDNTNDLGIELVHDVTGKPRNFLHSIAVPKDHGWDENLTEMGFKYLHGFIGIGNIPMSVYIRPLSLVDVRLARIHEQEGL